MATEDLFVARMEADGALMLVLTGGVHTAGEVGLEGITRESAPAAFSGGYLLPCSLVKHRGRIPTADVVDVDKQITSARQVVEIWLYEDRSYTAIDAAAARLYELLQGHMFTNSFECRLANVIDRQRDTGSLAGASLARLDFQIDSIIQ